jgi:hypothetical protein
MVSGKVHVRRRCVAFKATTLAALPTPAKKMRSQLESRSPGQRKAIKGAGASVTPPSQCTFSSSAVTIPDRFHSCSDMLWYIYQWTEETIDGIPTEPFPSRAEQGFAVL